MSHEESRRLLSTTREDAEAELAFHNGNARFVLRSRVCRAKCEEHKERGDACFAQGRVRDAVDAYNIARNAMRTLEPRSPLDRRLLAILHSNCAACYLATGGPWLAHALPEALAAVKEDPTFEKGWMRLGAAHEGVGDREEALKAYRTISSNAVAAERIAVLEAPPIVVTTEGLSGIAEGSLDLGRLAACESARVLRSSAVSSERAAGAPRGAVRHIRLLPSNADGGVGWYS
jgi:tetratricopeptide (TPR) repeat protein